MRDRKKHGTSAAQDRHDVGDSSWEEPTGEADAGAATSATGPDGELGAGSAEDRDGEPGGSEHENVVVAEEPPSEDALLRDLEELQDRHLRLAAEFENYRKRTRRELAETRKRSQAELVRGLLEVLDDLSRVAHAAPDATVESLSEGVGLVEAKLRKTLGDAGLQPIDAAGQPFDPNLHEALITRPTDDPEEDEMVGGVLLEGYMFGDLLVRPARVEVMKFEPAPESSEAGDSNGEDAWE